MYSNRISKIKLKGRVLMGAFLHHLGLYKWLLPVYMPHPTGVLKRWQAYLAHYYQNVNSAEAVLYFNELSIKMACDLRDHMLEPYITNNKPIYEWKEIDYTRKKVRKGDHILDIGANHGFWGFSLARFSGELTHLYLAEPNPTLIKRLRRTQILNKGLNTHILPYAINDGVKNTSTFYLSENNLSGLGSTVLHETAVKNHYLEPYKNIIVPSRSIDQLVASGDIKGMDIVKIDVEHGEDAVIHGAVESLKRYQPRLIMVETSNKSESFKMLNKMNYSAFVLDRTGKEVSVPSSDIWDNIFFKFN